jgi:hypothetical protein
MYPSIFLVLLFFISFDPTHILSQPLSVESDVGFGELKQRMVAQGEEVIAKFKGLVPDSNLSEVCTHENKATYETNWIEECISKKKKSNISPFSFSFLMHASRTPLCYFLQ